MIASSGRWLDSTVVLMVLMESLTSMYDGKHFLSIGAQFCFEASSALDANLIGLPSCMRVVPVAFSDASTCSVSSFDGS